MSELIGGENSNSGYGFTAKTWCRNTVTSTSTATDQTYTVSADTTSGNAYNGGTYWRLGGYGVYLRVGYTNSTTGASGWLGSTTDTYNLNAKVAFIAKSVTFKKLHYTQSVKFGVEYWGTTVDGHSASKNSGSLWNGSYTVPALASYTVSYNGNGGSNVPGSQTKWYGESLTLSSTVPTREGYTFQGWSDGTNTYWPGGTFTANNAVTLYAQWTLVTYQINYKPNGGSGSDFQEIKYYGETIELSGQAFSRDNYYQSGWNTAANGTGTQYGLGSQFSGNYGLTLYAQWSRSYGAPDAPTNVSVAYNNDFSQTISWSNSPSAYPKEWAGVRIYRSCDDANWVQIDDFPASVTSHADNNTTVGSKYTYWVQSYNNAGVATSSSATVYTTPFISRITATKPSTSAVTLTLEGMTAYYDGVEFQASSDGGATWSNVSVSKTGTNTWADNSPLAGAVIYRVRSYKDGRYSDWVTSSEITTICVPNAPAVTVNDSSSTYATGTDLVVNWIPNHPDGTAQSKAQIEISYQLSSVVDTIDISGSTTSYAFTGSVTGTYKVRVRTYGLYAEWGAWSSYVTFRVANEPTVTVTNPGTDSATITELPLETTWEIVDTTGVAYQQLTLASSTGQTLISKSLDNNTRSYSLAGALGLLNEMSYTLTLTVRGGSGLTKTVTRTFATKWDLPDVPMVTVTYTDEFAAQIVVGEEGSDSYNPSGTASPDIVYYTLNRTNIDGTTTLLGDNLSTGTVIFDPLPPLNTEFAYEVIGHAESGITSIRTYKTTLDSQGYELYNFGTTAGVVLPLMFNASVSESPKHSGETFHFALDSDENDLPTFYPDGSIDVSGSHSYEVYGKDTYIKVRDISRKYTLGWFRSYWGWTARVQADISTSYEAGKYMLWDVDVSVLETKWEDPYGIGDNQ